MENSNIKIFLADDEEDILEFLVDCFEDEGFQVKSFSNGKDVFEYLKSGNECHILLSDAHMPELGGFELLKKLKEFDLIPQYFYLCTGDIVTSEKEIIENGGTGIIAKPFLVDDVVQIIKKLHIS